MSSKIRGAPSGHKARTRKTVQTVDINPLSYDRTDPFTALNVLRQLLALLASLPARIGGCQYKLSPILDERGTEPESIPSDILTTDTDLESTDDELGMHVKQERFLAAALARMTALDSLT
ncbi:hypothetical protein SCP_1502670 [Sparassis crispa]|uniref:Uncharacterized protein n=1 Tax=Sparassis crispa TaxID=139825 RepID=A0A401H4F1_9APHY|nr:hypothetical protein SCP_1502670 [Sparassis crispa]GBE89259.1 hypothetical protein SCP_1502670 [Sparassis crispa]